MFLVAAGYYYMNKADPDCGTSFSWVTKAMGPQLGWIAGWTIVVADVIVMANLAQIAGLYTFLLFGWDSAAASTVAVTAVGVLWIVADDRDRADRDRALGPHPGRPAGGGDLHPGALRGRRAGQGLRRQRPGRLDRPEPLLVQPVQPQPERASRPGCCSAVFIYWGWDTTATVNEETEDPAEAPGRATVISTLILLGIYVVVAVAAQAYAGVDSWSPTRKTCSARSAPKSSARRSTRS